MSPRQRRGLLLLLAGLIGLAGTFLAVLDYTRSVARQLGPVQPVIVAARDIAAYTPLREDSFEVRRVPVAFAPPDAVTRLEEVRGLVSPVRLPVGTFVQRAGLTQPPALRFGERAVTVTADIEMTVGGSLRPGDVVMVMAAGRSGSAARGYVVVEAAPVLAVSAQERDGTAVTLALAREDALRLTEAKASGGLVLGRFPPLEASR